MGLKVNKGSFIYMLAYEMKPERLRPSWTNLCSLFWRSLGMLLLGWPLYVAAWLVVATVTLLFGRHTTKNFLQYDPDSFYQEKWVVKFERWPTFRGHRIWPITVFLAALALYCIFRFTEIAALTVVVVAAYAILMAFLALIGQACSKIQTKVMRVKGTPITENSSNTDLIIAWLVSKKQKACPIIEFTEK